MPTTTIIQPKTRRYRGVPYWEQEQPRTASTDKLLVSYYPTAGKFQVSALWKDKHSGEVKRGRTAVLDASELAASPEALSLLEAFLNQARS
ncbi:MAG: hypothetical protein OJF52_004238 [Nitrospira sp.]|jgi:hypothetical protein|nr:MAG: hypothetical protein OJF52_004238 [Nitrospira sp.]